MMTGQTEPRQMYRYQITEKQVTQGHNIIGHGWAAASNPHPHPMPTPHQLTYHKLVIQGLHLVSGTRCPALKAGLRPEGLI